MSPHSPSGCYFSRLSGELVWRMLSTFCGARGFKSMMLGGLLLVTTLSVLITSPLQSQQNNSRWDSDQWQHLFAGAAVSIVIRGPMVTPTWRDTWWKRGLMLNSLSLIFEVYQHHTWPELTLDDHALDLLATASGWALTEVLDWGLGKL